MDTLFSKRFHNPINQVWRKRLALIFILLLMSVLLSRGIYNPAVSGFADAERHLMDGVFILDFFHKMPLHDMYHFTSQYYAQYPALSIGYHPPLFPFVEAIFNALFGINIWSSRLALLLFAIVGIVAWFKLVQRIFTTRVAFWSSALLVTTPYVIQWGWYTMAEIPALSMALLTAYIFYRFIETEKPVYLYTSAMVFSVSLWTKQTAIFLLLWFALYLIIKKQLLHFIRRKETWIAGAIVIVMIAPLILITLWLGDQNLDQSIGQTKYSRLSWENLKIYLSVLIHSHLTLPLTVLCCIGLVWAIERRDNRCVYFAGLIVSVYVVFTFLNAKVDRYTIFWIPAFCLFAVLPVFYLKKHKIFHSIGIMVLTATVIYQVICIYKIPLFYITGYDEAVHYILRENKTPVVFFDGRHKNYFIYLMRAYDDKKSMYILRGDKLLTSSSIIPGRWLKVHAHSCQDIEEIFDEYGISYVVIESEEWTGLEIHQELRSFLSSGPFTLVKEIPVKTNRWQPRTLKIYRYINAKPMTANFLKLRLPSVGQTLNVPMQHLQAAEMSVR